MGHPSLCVALRTTYTVPEICGQPQSLGQEPGHNLSGPFPAETVGTLSGQNGRAMCARNGDERPKKRGPAPAVAGTGPRCCFETRPPRRVPRQRELRSRWWLVA